MNSKARSLSNVRLGIWYHITARRIQRRPIFRDDRDRSHFLELLEEFRDRSSAWRPVNPVRSVPPNSQGDRMQGATSLGKRIARHPMLKAAAGRCLLFDGARAQARGS